MGRGLRILGGLAKAYVEDKEEKEAAVKEINNAKREWLFKAGLEKIAQRKKVMKESSARISRAVELGFDRDAAVVLESTGELEAIITRAQKLSDNPDKIYNGQFIKKMSRAILENVPEQKIAQAISYAFDLGAEESMDTAKLIDIVFSATDEASMAEAVDQVTNISSSRGDGLDPLNVNLAGLTSLDPVKEAQITKNVTSRIAPFLGGQFSVEKDRYVFADDTSAAVIVNKAVDYIKEKRSDPFFQGDVSDLTSEVGDVIEELTRGQGIPLATIADTFEFGMNPSEIQVNDPPLNDDLNTTIKPPSSIIDENNLATGGN